MASRIPAAEAATWAQGLAHAANDHRYYELTHEALGHQFEHYYLLLQDRAGTTRAIQPFLLVDQDVATGLPGPMRRVLQAVREKFPSTLFMRMLMVGCSAGEGHLVRDAQTGGDALGRAGAARGAAAGGARAEGGHDRLQGFPEGLPRVAGRAEPRRLRARAEHARLAAWTCAFTDFDDYLANKLSKKTRKNLRLKYRQAAAGPKTELQVVADIAPYIDEVFPLYQQVLQQIALQVRGADQVLLPQPRPHAWATARVFFIWRQNGKAVAFSSCAVHEGVLRDHYIGLDYDVALERHLYFVTWRDIFTWAIENGCHSYYSAPLNYEPKYHLRHDLVPLDLYVRTVNDWLNPLFRRVIRYLEPTRYDPMIRKFGNAHELW